MELPSRECAYWLEATHLLHKESQTTEGNEEVEGWSYTQDHRMEQGKMRLMELDEQDLHIYHRIGIAGDWIWD